MIVQQHSFFLIVKINDLPNFRHIASLVSHLYSASFFSMSFIAVGNTEKHVNHNTTNNMFKYPFWTTQCNSIQQSIQCNMIQHNNVSAVAPHRFIKYVQVH